MPRLPLEPMEKNLVFLPLLAIDDALIVSRLLQPARLRASAVGMKNLRSTASGFRAPSAASQPPTRRCTVSHALFGRKIQVTPRAVAPRGRKRAFSRHCEPTGRREAPPDDRLREAFRAFLAATRRAAASAACAHVTSSSGSSHNRSGARQKARSMVPPFFS